MAHNDVVGTDPALATWLLGGGTRWRTVTNSDQLSVQPGKWQVRRPKEEQGRYWYVWTLQWLCKTYVCMQQQARQDRVHVFATMGMFGQMELGLEVRQNIGHDMVLYRTKVLMLYTCYLKIVSQLPTRILCKFHNSTARLKMGVPDFQERHGKRCDCGNQLALAMQQIEAAGRGVLVYLRGHEGRGIGLGHKLRAYNLQDDGRDTVKANEELRLPVDSREYGIGAQILRDLGVQSMKLMTNNLSKYIGLIGYGLTVSGRIPCYDSPQQQQEQKLPLHLSLPPQLL
ncbi:hypothetical protein KIW84_051274 [Lathyrus oleraceus]|uniref:GTP cyclohydrolase II n=1 Tax=Pisum sativum TaxID=3888 RepID=A0A9D4WLN6_PEA|nr:hypothetical protein KIW84_051274 [Pisum sativum]